MAEKQVIEPNAGAAIDFTEAGIGAAPGYAALDARRLATAGAQQQGVAASTAYHVIEREAGANMSVDITMTADGGYATVKGTAKNSQGLYVVPPHKEKVNLTVAASDATNPRIDAIALRVYDNVEDASGKNTAELEYLKGTAESGATLENLKGRAATPASSMVLACILVPAKAASVTAANVQDERTAARPGAFILNRSNSFTARAGDTIEAAGGTITVPVAQGLPITIFATLGPVTIKPASGSIYGDFVLAAASITLTTNQHITVTGDGGSVIILAGEPKREQLYTRKAFTKVEAEAGVEPSATRLAAVNLHPVAVGVEAAVTVGGQAAGFIKRVENQIGQTTFFVNPGEKWKANQEVEAFTRLL